MRKMLCVLLLAMSGCYYQGYAVRKVVNPDPPLSREEVERLTTAGVSEPVVQEMVEKRGVVALSPDDLVALKKANVPDAVVQKMIANERKEPANVAVEDYYGHPGYTYGYPYYGYGYGYPYYGSFSYGVGWGWGWGYHNHYHSHPRGYAGVRVYR
jgi:hypothetical protein